MVTGDKNGIVIQQFPEYEDISFALRNAGSTPVTVRFFAENTNIPLESGQILGSAGTQTPVLGAFGFAQTIQNNKLYVATSAGVEIYNPDNLTAPIGFIANATVFPILGFARLPSRNEIWVLTGAAGGLDIDVINTNTDSITGTTFIGLLFLSGSQFVWDAPANLLWLWDTSGTAVGINATTLLVSTTIAATAVGGVFGGVQFSLNGKILFATTQSVTGNIEVFNITDQNLFNTFTGLGTPTSVDHNEDENALYANDVTNDTLIRIDLNNNNTSILTTSVDISGTPSFNSFGNTIAVGNGNVYFITAAPDALSFVPTSNFTDAAIQSFTTTVSYDSLFLDDSKRSLILNEIGGDTIGLWNTENNNQLNEITPFAGATLTQQLIGNDPTQLYALDTTANRIDATLYSPQLELLGSTAQGGAQQAYREIKFNPVYCTEIKFDSGSNRNQPINPLEYINSSAAGVEITKRQPLIWELTAQQEFSILKLTKKTLTKEGVMLDGQRGFLLTIDPNTDIYIEFALKKQAFTDQFILCKPNMRSHLEGSNFRHPNVFDVPLRQVNSHGKL